MRLNNDTSANGYANLSYRIVSIRASLTLGSHRELIAGRCQDGSSPHMQPPVNKLPIASFLLTDKNTSASSLFRDPRGSGQKHSISAR